jgi:hypothetical protein
MSHVGSFLAEVTGEPEACLGVLERLWGCGGIGDGDVKGGGAGWGDRRPQVREEG